MAFTGVADRVLNRRLAALERQERKRRTQVAAWTWNQLAMTITCPPSQGIHIRAGWVQQGSFWAAQETIWFPALDIDFTDPSQFLTDVYGETYTGAFSNAYWYMPLLLMYSNDYFFDLRDGEDNWGPLRNFGDCPEYETAGEAEAAAEDWFDGATAIYNGDLPLALVILRNNGIEGVDGQVMEVDRVNRGRSYLYRDIRPRNVCPYFEW